ncbi:MAG: CBS domain-containing protein [Desulfovibrionales bacterium]
MMRDFVTIGPEDLVIDADKLMEEHQLWMLLVTDKSKLVGYLRKEDVRSAMPSPMTSLSKHELNYLLSKLSVRKLIRKDLTTVRPETEIEVAADIMHKKNLAGLAVVDGKNNLVGFINRSGMLEVLVEEMGLTQGGARIAFEVEDRTGVMAEVSAIIFKLGISIISTATFFHGQRRMVVFRIGTDDPRPVEDALRERGYAIVGPETFSGEWH